LRKNKGKITKTLTTKITDASHNNPLEVERLMIESVDDIYNLFD
jgi:hypothetical protein